VSGIFASSPPYLLFAIVTGTIWNFLSKYRKNNSSVGVDWCEIQEKKNYIIKKI
jgi:hypothetical protein